jgi:hypothetical protein
VRNHHRGGVHARAAILHVSADAQQAQLAQALEKGRVETLLAIEGKGLRLHLSRRKVAHHFAQARVLLRGVEEVKRNAPR